MVKGTEVKATLTEFAQATDAAKAKAVTDAVSANDMVALRTALSDATFKDVDLTSAGIAQYKDAATDVGVANIKTVADVQNKVIYEVNVVNKVSAAVVVDTQNSNAVDELKLYDALDYGAKAGVLTDVNLANYFTGYKTAAADNSSIKSQEDIDTVAEIQAKIISPAKSALIIAADTALKDAQDNPTDQTKIDAAQAAIDKVAADFIGTVSTPSTSGTAGDLDKLNVKDTYNARLNDVRTVKTVSDAVATNDQAKILTAIQNSKFARINADYKVTYSEDLIKGDITTVAKIQTIIDTANIKEVEKVVAGANMQLDSAKVTNARTLVNTYLLDGEADAITLKGYYTDLLDLEDSIIAVVNAKTDSDLKTALVNLDTLENKLVAKYNGKTLELSDGSTNASLPVDEFDINTVKDGLLSQYRDITATTENKDKNQRKDIQAIINKGNQGVVDVAVASVKNATTSDQVLAALKSDTLALKNVKDFLADKYLAFTRTSLTDKNSVQTLVDTVNRAETVTALKAVRDYSDADADAYLKLIKAPILGLTDINDTFKDNYLAQKEMTGHEISDDTTLENPSTDLTPEVKKVQDGVVKTGNDSVQTNALGAVATACDGSDKAALLAKLQDANLALANVKAENADAYFADKALIKTNADTKAYAQAIVDTINAIVSVNAATNATEMKAALVNYVSANQGLIAKTVDTTFLNISSTSKLEVADLVLTARKAVPTTAVFADNTAVAAALGADDKNGALRTYADMFTDINALTSDSTITDVRDAIDAFKYDKFEALDVQDKLTVAETVKNALAFNDDKSLKTKFTTIAQVKAAVDAAIATK